MDTKDSRLSKLLETAYIVPPISGSSQINVGNTERIISTAGGALLAYYGFKKGDLLGIAIALTGGSLLFRGVTGYCPVNDAVGRDTAEKESVSIEITRSLTIQKPRKELYAYWRRLENLPNFMKHLKEVRKGEEKRSHWEARIPGDIGTVDWEADVTEEKENEFIAWQSIRGSQIDNAGEVRFKDAPAGRGTVVRATISYRPPAGAIGSGAAKLLNPLFKQMVKEDLRRFKRLMESGEIPTIEGQPSGRA